MKKNDKSRFGKVLVEFIKNVDMTQSDFYTKIGIKKPYFYDIVSGKANPPPAELQFEMIKILKLKPKERNEFLKIAAEERNELPADIVKYLGQKEINKIRSTEEYKKLIGGIIDGKKGNKN